MEAWKRTVEQMGADVTATSMRDYRYRPTWRSIHAGLYYVRSICIIAMPDRLTEEPYSFVHADPSRRVYGKSPFVFAPNVVEMHEMTSVRAPGGMDVRAANSPLPDGCRPPAEPMTPGACDCVEVKCDKFSFAESIADWQSGL